SSVFAVDTVSQTAFAWVSRPAVCLADSSSAVSSSFSEAPTDFTLANTSAVGGTLGPLTASQDGKTYSATFTAAAGTDISTGSVSVDSTWHEAQGNPGTGATIGRVEVGTVAT